MIGHRPNAPATTPLRGRYLVRNRVWNAWLRANDMVLDLVHGGAPDRATSPSPPARVLIAVSGHLGDAVIATSLLSQIRRAFPDARIGILTGSWNRRVFEGHPLIAWIHTADHWKLDRSGASLPRRWLLARRTHAKATAEIRSIGYDAALDLSPYFPNFSKLLFDARLPVRVGYTTGGGGARYTRRVQWTGGRHVAEDHLRLLSELTAKPAVTGSLAYALGPLSPDVVQRAEQKVRGWGLSPKSYVVIHAGAGLAQKEWPMEKWRAVAAQLGADGARLVLTGAGARQRAIADQIASGVAGALNLCDQLDWDEFRFVLGQARVVLTVDTVAMHVAAAEGTPCVTLMTGIDDTARWRPLGEHITVVSHAVVCAPCYLSRGCIEMSCIREVTPARVLDAARAALAI